MPKTDRIRLSDYGFTILQVETQPYCNMNCEFCAYPVRKDRSEKLKDSDFTKIIDSIDPEDSKLEYICLSHFNEPLLDERIFDFIKYAKNKKLRTLLITNGLVFSSSPRAAETIKKLVDAAPTKIKVSLQTLNENTFKARGINYPFDRYKQGIIKFLKAALDSRCKSEITLDIACNFLTARNKIARKLAGIEHGDPSVPDTIDSIRADMLAFLQELNEYDKRFGFDRDNVEGMLKRAVPKYLDQTGIAIADNIRLKIKRFMYGRRLSRFHPLGIGRPCETTILGILSSGTVVPCCLAYDDKLAMGNIKTKSLKEILDSSKGLLEIIKIKGGINMPHVCKICQGAPTRHGAMLIEVARGFRNSIKGKK